jgi:hypothetical protein
MNKHRYLIIGCGNRTGTTVVHLLLKGHPEVAALNDELRISPLFTQKISTFTFGKNAEIENEKGLSALFDTITSITATPKTTAIGAKCICMTKSYAQTLLKTLPEFLPDLKVILMVRRDLIAQYGSNIHAERTGLYHSLDKNFENRKIHPVRMKKWAYAGYALKLLTILDILRELHKTHHVLECSYENLLFDPEEFYKRLFRFIEISAEEVNWAQLKKILPSPEEYIKNYKKIERFQEEYKQRFNAGKIPLWEQSLGKIMVKLCYPSDRLKRYRRKSKRKKLEFFKD